VRVPSPRNRAQKKSKVQVKLKRAESLSYVLCLSGGRAQKDRAIREQKEKRLLGDLEKLQARIDNRRLVNPMKIGEAIGRLKERYPRVARYYDIAYDTDTKRFTYTANEPRRHIAEQLDGSYVLKTDRSDLSADEAWRIYSLLSRAENAFRSMKSPLAERPIFHQIERRVETHIFLCVLGYHLLVAIEKTLLDQGVHTSWATVRETLKTHQVCTVVLPTDRGAMLRIRQGSTPEPEHKALYKRLKVPEQIIRAKKIWSDQAAD
jgi:transposase